MSSSDNKDCPTSYEIILGCKVRGYNASYQILPIKALMLLTAPPIEN